MAQQALSSGSPTKRRVVFGMFAADGWIWASLKAAFWFLVIIMVLAYLPDRAYYFTVFPTIDLGVNPAYPPSSYVTPINLCPPSNAGLPCPPPAGAVVPWQLSPSEISLPAGRTDGAVVQAGTKLIFIGGSDGKTASADVYVAETVNGSTFDKWKAGPKLPEARARAAVVFDSGNVFVVGGQDAAGKPTTTVYELSPNTQTGDLGTWKTLDAAALPAPRTAAALAVAPDGLILVGGDGGTGPTTSVWKSTFDANGQPTAWVANAPLIDARSGALAQVIGDYLWIYGGSDASGPSRIVQRGLIQTGATAGSGAAASPGAGASPGGGSSAGGTSGGGASSGGTSGGGAAGAASPSAVVQWAVQAPDAKVNLPVARTDAAGFASNGVIYLAGGTDGTSPKGEVYWAIPDGNGDIAGWEHLPAADLPSQGLAGSAAVVSGATVFLIGGTTSGGVIAQAARAGLSPQPPFFQLGLLGATIPGLAIQGEIGQQLGYLAAAGVGTVDFILLVIIGYALAHREKTRAFFERLRRRRSA